MPCPDCQPIADAYCAAIENLKAWDENCVRSTITEEGQTVQNNQTRSSLAETVRVLGQEYRECIELQSDHQELFSFTSRGIAKQCNRPLEFAPGCCDESGCELE